MNGSSPNSGGFCPVGFGRGFRIHRVAGAAAIVVLLVTWAGEAWVVIPALRSLAGGLGPAGLVGFLLFVFGAVPVGAWIAYLQTCPPPRELTFTESGARIEEQRLLGELTSFYPWKEVSLPETLANRPRRRLLRFHHSWIPFHHHALFVEPEAAAALAARGTVGPLARST
ncbi:MAG: hypothetical protein L3K00_03775 [Thermoplasmata archaeon]|nr:hypothetical protein [Thermoplasmata archaeon]